MYIVTVLVSHNDKEVFEISKKFQDNESRDNMRAFLRDVGGRIESYDFHFDDDDFGCYDFEGYE